MRRSSAGGGSSGAARRGVVWSQNLRIRRASTMATRPTRFCCWQRCGWRAAAAQGSSSSYKTQYLPTSRATSRDARGRSPSANIAQNAGARAICQHDNDILPIPGTLSKKGRGIDESRSYITRSDNGHNGALLAPVGAGSAAARRCAVPVRAERRAEPRRVHTTRILAVDYPCVNPRVIPAVHHAANPSAGTSTRSPSPWAVTRGTSRKST